MNHFTEIQTGNKLQLFKGTFYPNEVNSYGVFSRETVIIADPGTGVGKALLDLEKAQRKNKFILLTHTHFDHICGIKELSGFLTGVSKDGKEGLHNPAYNLSTLIGEPFSIEKPVTVELLRGENVFGDIVFQCIPCPGHTTGDCMFDFGSFILTGDFVFKDSIGRTDLPFSDAEKMRNSIEHAKKYFLGKEGNTAIYTGHGPSSTVKDILERNPFFGGYF